MTCYPVPITTTANLMVSVLICSVSALRAGAKDRCEVGCLANNADNSGIPYPAGVGLRPTRAHNSTSPQHVAGQSRGPGLVVQARNLNFQVDLVLQYKVIV